MRRQVRWIMICGRLPIWSTRRAVASIEQQQVQWSEFAYEVSYTAESAMSSGQGISVPHWTLDMPLHTQCHLNRGRDLVIWVHGSVCVWFLCCFRLLYIQRHLSLMMAGDEGESGEFGRHEMEVNKGLRADVGWWSGVYSPCRVFHSWTLIVSIIYTQFVIYYLLLSSSSIVLINAIAPTGDTIPVHHMVL